jgi:hypothetical protein
VEVNAGEAKGRRNERGRRFPVRAEPLAIEEQLGVELTGAPGGEDRVEVRLADLE